MTMRKPSTRMCFSNSETTTSGDNVLRVLMLHQSSSDTARVKPPALHAVSLPNATWDHGTPKSEGLHGLQGCMVTLAELKQQRREDAKTRCGASYSAKQLQIW